MRRGPGEGSGPSLKSLAKTARPRSGRASALRLARYLRPYRRHLIVAFIWVVVAAVMLALIPALTGRAIDAANYAHWSGGAVPATIWELGTAMLVAGAISWFATRRQILAFSEAGICAIRDMRNAILKKQQDLDVEYLESTLSGDLLSRLINDVKQVDSVFTGTIRRLTQGLVSLVVTTVAMFLLDWRLALVTLVAVGLALVIFTPFGRVLRRAFRSRQKAVSKVSEALAEEIESMKVAQAFNRVDYNFARFQARNAANQDAQINAALVSTVFPASLELASGLALAAVVGLGGYLALSGAATVGTVVAFTAYAPQLFKYAMTVASLNADAQSALASAERVFEFLDAQPRVIDPESPAALDGVEGRITFENVHFAYAGKRDGAALTGIDLCIEAGETVALVGRTGSGKTTLSGLIARLYDPQKGSVRVDGRDVRSMSTDQLRAHIGYAPQVPVLFDGTIADNVRWSRRDASDEDVLAALESIGAAWLVDVLPQGLETRVGRRGGALSTGQRQLVSLARAVLRDPAILVLDEPTGSIDQHTEASVMSRLRATRRGKTTVVIAHRMSAARHSDRMIVMDHGEIVASGTFEELADARALPEQAVRPQAVVAPS